VPGTALYFWSYEKAKFEIAKMTVRLCSLFVASPFGHVYLFEDLFLFLVLGFFLEMMFFGETESS
jgi:hypothetical protein